MSRDAAQELKEYWNDDYKRGFSDAKSHSVPSGETNRRLTAMEEAIKDLPVRLTRIDDKLTEHTKVHSDILTAMEKGFTSATTRLDLANGRTKTNELHIAYASGGLAVISLIAVPLLAWALYTLVNLQVTITDVVQDTLNHYEFEISN